MNTGSFAEKIAANRDLEARIGFNPYYPDLESGLDDPVIIAGKPYINLASNNYLGLACDTRVKEAMIAAVSKYGASLCGTPVATGNIDLYHRTELELARFVGLEDAVILPSCYQANNGLFSAVARKEDLAIVDHFAHSSLIEGVRGVGCKIRPFLHNSMEHLRQILERNVSKYRQVFVVTESVFSTEGSVAPFREIVELTREFNAIPVIDDSHGIGVLGANGGGILEAAGITDFEGIYTASLGKALANSGGLIAGKKELIEYLKYYCSHLVYSTALAPAVLGGIAAVLKIIGTDFKTLNAKIRLYKTAIEKSLQAEGFEIASGNAPLVSIVSGGMEATLLLTKRFYDHGILTTPFVEPSVPPDGGRVRLIAAANLKEDTIATVIANIKKIGSLI